MALTYTPPAELEFSLPNFELFQVDKIPFATSSIPKDHSVLVSFICNHCPYVKAIEDRLISLYQTFKNEKLTFIGICANDWNDYPEDHPLELFKRWKEKSYGFPYLIDEDQSVAKSFDAACTPDFFLFNRDKKLVYRGRLDDSWKTPENVMNQDLKNAIELTLLNKPINIEQIPSMGCSIKWK